MTGGQHGGDGMSDMDGTDGGVDGGVRMAAEYPVTQLAAQHISLAYDRTTVVAERLRDDGVAYAYTSHWRGRDVVRFSVSNWATDEAAVAATVDAVRRAAV